jgi:hypothetical protein
MNTDKHGGERKWTRAAGELNWGNGNGKNSEARLTPIAILLFPISNFHFYPCSSVSIRGFIVFLDGGAMPRYLTQHTLACLTRQGAEALLAKLPAEGEIAARRALVNMVQGKMLLEFDAPSQEALAAWLDAHGWHRDWLLRIEYESRDGKLITV